jgi:hypothetical protein
MGDLDTFGEAGAIAGNQYRLDAWILTNVEVVGLHRASLQKRHGDFLPVTTRWRFQSLQYYNCSCGEVFSVDFGDRPAPKSNLALLRRWAADHLLSGNHFGGKARGTLLGDSTSGKSRQVAHEVFTALNAIIGFAEVLLGGDAGPMTQEQAELLGHIRESGQQLLTVFRGLLGEDGPSIEIE